MAVKSTGSASRPGSRHWRPTLQRGVDAVSEYADVAAQKLGAVSDPRARLLRKRRWALRFGVFFSFATAFWVSVTGLLAVWNTPVWALLITGLVAAGAAVPATLWLLRYRWLRGEPLPHHGFITLFTDITAQRRYERMIREQNAELERRVAQRTAELQSSNRQLRNAHEANQQITAALRRSEERLRLITDTVPAMIGYFDRDEVYRYVNKGYADWFGHSKDRVLGRSIAEVVSPEVYAAVAPHVRVALQGQRVSYEYATPGLHGRTMHARSELVPEIGPDGDGIHGTMRTITVRVGLRVR